MGCPAFRSAIVVFVGPVIVWRGRRLEFFSFGRVRGRTLGSGRAPA